MTVDYSARIPTVGEYRGVGLHDNQDEERLAIVRSHIDQVFLIRGDIKQLLEFIEWRPNAPEARLLAAAFLHAYVEQAKDARRATPAIDLELVDGWTAMLNSARCRDPRLYDSIFMPRWAPGSPNRPMERKVPLP